MEYIREKANSQQKIVFTRDASIMVLKMDMAKKFILKLELRLQDTFIMAC